MAALGIARRLFDALPGSSRVGLLALLCFFLRLGGAPLFDVDEGAFSAATMEMLVRGDFVMTYLGGQPRFDKPILIYWLQAASVSLFGLNEWALRLPSALAASGWVFAVYRFARRFDENTGQYAAMVLACALAPMIIGRAATADALLNLLIGAALLDAWRHLESGKRAPLLRMYAWIGFGLLAKGPIAVLVPIMASFAWCALERQWRRFFVAAFDPLGWVILLAIAAPWYVAIYIDQGQAFIDGFVLKHNVGRFSATMLGHGGSPFYYLALLPLVLLPFTGLFVAVLSGLRGQWRDPLDRYLWLAFGSVFLFFSLSATQLPHYILYGATPLAILMARHRGRLTSGWLTYAPGLVFGVGLLFLPELVGLRAPRGDTAQYREMIEHIGTVLGPTYRMGVGLFVATVVGLWLLRRSVPSSSGLVAVAVAQVLLMALVLLPVAGRWQQESVVEAAEVARRHSEPVVTWGVNLPSFAVYRGAVTPVRRPEAGEIALTRAERLAELPPAEILYRSGGLLLAKFGDPVDAR
jgi:4-amino-4-deoxy-L-arabinose transferase-like glycosyltransferase